VDCAILQQQHILMDNNTPLNADGYTPQRGVTAQPTFYTTSYYGLIVGTISGTTWTFVSVERSQILHTEQGSGRHSD